MIGEKAKLQIYLGSDHAGFEAKNMIKEYLEAQGYETIDLGAFNAEPSDYPDMAREVGEKVLEHAEAFGILICGTGTGMAMAANKLRGVRAVVAMDENIAEMSRRHNNANILALGAKVTDLEKMKGIVSKFLTTEFEKGEERHVRRVAKMDGGYNNM